MSVEAFLDSNILLYAASKDSADATKSTRAAQLIAETNFGVSLQVAQEFYHNARLKARLAITSAQIETIINLLLARPLVVTDAELFADARRLCDRFQLRYWDAAIVAAAVRLRAPILYSEDLSDGQEFHGVRVVNPFLDHG
jgi:predicted nucleic acid-binding protein